MSRSPAVTRWRSSKEKADARSVAQRARLYCRSMIPRVEPEGMLFRKPVSTPDQVRGRLFRDHAHALQPMVALRVAEIGGAGHALEFLFDLAVAGILFLLAAHFAQRARQRLLVLLDHH